MGRLLGVTQAAVWRWLDKGLHLPAEHVLKVESATGISRHQLRPDLYPLADVEHSSLPAGRTTVGEGPLISDRDRRPKFQSRQLGDPVR
ncbi:MAG: helix-turn-helix domain-containing protein [Pseudomonadota bacterium]|nr:helix-turn-helix domain-containing protein [Pseudomonadota bacterium]